MMQLRKPGLISLFCGPGGLDEGFKEAGFQTLLAYDIDRASVETHRHNHPEAQALVADLSKLTVSQVIAHWRERSSEPPVGVIGGPPCQSFSVSNVHQTEDDPRHRLPTHYTRILRGLNAAFGIDFFVFENVPGLVTRKHLERFAQFQQGFERAGYSMRVTSLDAQRFGVAQVRRRVFAVGINRVKHSNASFHFPDPSDQASQTVRQAIGSLPPPAFFRTGLCPDDIPYHPNHWCMNPRSRRFEDGRLTPGVIAGRSFRVLSWDKPSYTVAYGHREVHIHPDCHRRLSVFEAMLLQGFRRSYELKGTLSDQIRLVSEAVSPPVARALAESLVAQLLCGEYCA
jgi:DNA (cytosine-5)-methyltransferase 1